MNRWTPGRKARLVQGVAAGHFATEDIKREYGISAEEFADWKRKLKVGGTRALRITKPLKRSKGAGNVG